MATLTIHMADEEYDRLLKLAERRQLSLNELVDEILTITLAEFDAETRFRTRTALGSNEEGLKLLDLLDR